MSSASEAMDVSDKPVLPSNATDDGSCQAAKDSLNEYETQLLGFTPVTLINGIFNSVCDLYREALKAFCSSCLEQYPNVMSEEELTKARHAVSQDIDKEICEVFDKLEVFALKNVFAIPDECILPEDVCQLSYSKEEGNKVQEKMVQIKRRIIAVKYANSILVRQLEEAVAFKEMLDKIMAKLEENNLGSSDAINVKDVLAYCSDTIMAAFRQSKTL